MQRNHLRLGSRLYRGRQHGKPIIKKGVYLFRLVLTTKNLQGSIIGQPLGDELRRAYGSNLAIEGIDYAALLSTNYLPGGTDLASELMMRTILERINSRCPSAIIVCGGYSYVSLSTHTSFLLLLRLIFAAAKVQP